jgi:hypothetical protein
VNPLIGIGVLIAIGYPLFIGLNIVSRRRNVSPVVVGLTFAFFTGLAMVMVIAARGSNPGAIYVGIPVCALVGFAGGYAAARYGGAFQRDNSSEGASS